MKTKSPAGRATQKIPLNSIMLYIYPRSPRTKRWHGALPPSCIHKNGAKASYCDRDPIPQERLQPIGRPTFINPIAWIVCNLLFLIFKKLVLRK